MSTTTFPAEPPPLTIGPGDAIYVSGSRVLLDVIVEAYLHGESAEQIAESYPTITLANVHGVLAYVLDHRNEVAAYLARRHTESQRVEAEILASQDDVSQFRQRLQERWLRRGGS